MKKIAILGSTGSIGTQTLEVARTNGDLDVVALAAGNNIELLEKQIREFHPKLAAVWNEKKAAELKNNIQDLNVKVVTGMDGLLEVAAIEDSCNSNCGDDRNPSNDRSYQSRKRYRACQ